ncbi:MAG: sugar nucleotide-binding protein [Actinocatenispora sp.]
MLVTGASGYLGARVAQRAVAAGWTVTGTFHRAAADVPGVAWRNLDITDRRAVGALVDDVRPDVVLHTAAGRDRNDWAVVADGAGTVAVAAADRALRLVHVSTDAVLSGADGPYDESAQPDPVHRYGAGKAAAETVVRAVAPGAVVVRTPLIVGDGQSKHERLVHELYEGAPGALFTDLYRTPVHVHDLSDALLELCASDFAGVLNVAGPDGCSWYEFGRLVAARDGLDLDRLPSGRAADFGAVLPADTRLCSDRASALLGTRLRGAREFLAARP